MNDDPLRRRRPRRLSEAERTLWSEVVRDVAPLQRAKASAVNGAVEAATETPAEPVKSVRKAKSEVQRPSSPPAAAPAAPPLAPLGRRMRQRIARGSHAIGGRLDLHGMTQREAHDALLRFLRTGQDRGVTLVLVITGKGKAGTDGAGERGVLKRQVPQWLRLPAFRELIVSFEPAHVTHGGEGALYVRLRRPRELR
jgi:DNA-nicking Smr family endonuclease